MTTSLLTAEKLEQYDRDGWVLVRGAAGPEVLKLARIVLERWADLTIESWVQRGLRSDPLRDLDFHHRLMKAWETAERPAYSRSPRRDLVSPELYRFLTHPDLLKIA